MFQARRLSCPSTTGRLEKPRDVAKGTTACSESPVGPSLECPKTSASSSRPDWKRNRWNNKQEKGEQGTTRTTLLGSPPPPETETPLTYGCGTLDLWQIVAQLLTFLLFFPHALRLGGNWARMPIEQFADGADGFQGWALAMRLTIILARAARHRNHQQLSVEQSHLARTAGHRAAVQSVSHPWWLVKSRVWQRQRSSSSLLFLRPVSYGSAFPVATKSQKWQRQQ